MSLAIRPLVLGEAKVRDALDVFWGLSSEEGRSSVPILAFLVLGAPGGPLVIDCGLRDADRATELFKLGKITVSPEQQLIAQLARHGVKPEDVKTLLLTHLHYDHAGNCALLPNARIIVQRTELMAAAAPMGPAAMPVAGGRDLFYDRKDIAEIIDPLWHRVELIEGNQTFCPGIELVLYSNTHSPGNQCVYLETQAGVAAVIGDIARKTELNIRQGIPPGIYYDLEATQRALADIGRRSDIILPTHDWGTVELGTIG